MNVFDQMIARYTSTTDADYINARHEVMQQVTLAGLQRSGFFSKAAFYGGTCLRIFYGLNRFSEDMDFSLLQRDNHFKLEDYFEPVINEFKALGRDVLIDKKEKKKLTNIESAFLKEDTSVYNLRFCTEPQIKIRIEVDINPPMDFSTEQRLLLLPFSFMTNCYSLPDLYAGKMHAMLFRNWKTRVKGRDWYDFEWYVRNNTILNFNHLSSRVFQTETIKHKDFTIADFKMLMKAKILKTNIDAVKADVRPFIKNPQEMNIWSIDYFTQLVDMIRFME
jgi:predicted nucleotidyltransferase component of viral defense system